MQDKKHHFSFHPIRWIFRTLFILMLGAIIGVFAVTHIPTLGDLLIHSEGQINGVTLFRSMKNIAEVATQEETVICEATYNEDNLKLFKTNFKIPLTKKHFEIRYHGTVKAGIKDADQIQIKMDEKAKRVDVLLPKSVILSKKIEPSSIELIRQTHNIINQLEVTDVAKLEAKEEKRIEKEAIKVGIIEKADKQMRKIMKNQLKALLGDSYEIHVETAEDDE